MGESDFFMWRKVSIAHKSLPQVLFLTENRRNSNAAAAFLFRKYKWFNTIPPISEVFTQQINSAYLAQNMFKVEPTLKFSEFVPLPMLKVKKNNV